MTKCDRCGEVNPAEIHTCTPKPSQWTDLTATEIKILRRAANNDKEFAALLIARFKEKNND